MAHQVLHRWVLDCLSGSLYIIPTFEIYLLTMVDVGLLPAARLGPLSDILHANGFLCPEHPQPPRFCLLHSSLPPHPTPPPLTSPENPELASLSDSYVTNTSPLKVLPIYILLV